MKLGYQEFADRRLVWLLSHQAERVIIRGNRVGSALNVDENDVSTSVVRHVQEIRQQCVPTTAGQTSGNAAEVVFDAVGLAGHGQFVGIALSPAGNNICGTILSPADRFAGRHFRASGLMADRGRREAAQVSLAISIEGVTST